MKMHLKAREEVAKGTAEYAELGEIIIGGDFNAHTGANGDRTKTDEAGKGLLEMIKGLGLTMVNTMGEHICKDEFTRVQELKTGNLQESTVDYVLITHGLESRIVSLVFEEDKMGSDHKPIRLTLDLKLGEHSPYEMYETPPTSPTRKRTRRGSMRARLNSKMRMKTSKR